MFLFGFKDFYHDGTFVFDTQDYLRLAGF